jgi:hypothetical protein
MVFSSATYGKHIAFYSLQYLDGTYNCRMLPGMTNNAIALQGILYGQNDQFYHALTKYSLDEFYIRNAYKNATSY